jgi:hypothetical protein
MKKIALMIAAATALAVTASAPAEAHRLHIFSPGGAIAAAAIGAIATDALVSGPGYGPGYYYGPPPVYFGAPVIFPHPGLRYRW